MFGRVGQGLGDRVPGGDLHPGGEPGAAQRGVGTNRGRHSRPRRLALDRVQQPAVGQDRRVDRVRHAAHILQQRAHLVLRLGQRLLHPRVTAAEALAGQAEPRAERHHLLLDAVVQVPLDPAALGVLSCDHPLPGRGQLRRKPDVAHRRAGLRRDVGQHPPVLLEQRPVPPRTALDRAVRRPGMRDRDDGVDRGRHRAENPRCRLPGGVHDRDPHPGDPETSPDGVRQPGQQLSGATGPFQHRPEALHRVIPAQPGPEDPAIPRPDQAPHERAERQRYRDRHHDRDARPPGSLRQQPRRRGDDRRRQPDHPPQRPAGPAAPSRLVDAQHAIVEDRDEDRAQGENHDRRPQHPRDQSLRVVVGAGRHQQHLREPENHGAGPADEEPADRPALLRPEAAVAQGEQYEPAQDDRWERPVGGLGERGQPRQSGDVNRARHRRLTVGGIQARCQTR